MSTDFITHAHVTCPVCGYGEELAIPADTCLFFHRCGNCNMLLKPAPGDCCVFAPMATRFVFPGSGNSADTGATE